MFYPVESLKRGGRFYLCWVADSWPLRFAAITHRQLWSTDIRKLCDDLREVVTNESGRPANRFSLRLSSQLMRGLVRLYEKKVTVLLGDLCMIHANVFKNTNKKWIVRETIVEAGQNVERPLPQLPWVQVPEEVEPEQQIMEMIQNSGNVVSNIQDITLKEATIPEFRLPPNDNFEENPDQVIQQIVADMSIEQMRVQKDASNIQLSGLELPLDVTIDKSLDKRQGDHLIMEQMPDLDKTVYRKSTGEELRPDFEKDIPEIPELPPPPAPEPEKPIEPPVIEVTEPIPEPEVAPNIPQVTAPAPAPVDIELEELEEQPQARKRRTKNRLIIDKKIRIDSEVLKERINNPLVEVRCEDSADDIIDLRVSWEILSRRPASAGHRVRTRISDKLTRMFLRHIPVGYVARDLIVEEVLDQPRRSTRLQTIVEEDEQPIQQPQMQHEQQNIPEINISAVPEEIVMGRHTDIEIPMELDKDTNVLTERRTDQMDISDLPTQKLETLSQQKKRVSEYDKSPKRQRLVGYMSFRESQSQRALEASNIGIDKENIPPSNRQTRQDEENIPSNEQTRRDEIPNITSMLQEAGISDLQAPVTAEPIEKEPQVRGRQESEGSETPLGSLDRTKVSLGDSIRTTDSQKFIRNQWGIEGTMVKIMGHIKAGIAPLSVESLINRGPVMPGYKRIIAARCFTSILKLKQHEFIKVVKDPETLEIRDISLGPKFSGLE